MALPKCLRRSGIAALSQVQELGTKGRKILWPIQMDRGKLCTCCPISHRARQEVQETSTSLATASVWLQLLWALDVEIRLHPSSQFFRHRCFSTTKREIFKKPRDSCRFFSTPLTVGTEKGKPDI